MKVYFSMFKRRMTNSLPLNFRHELMNSVAKHIDSLITPYVDLMILEDDLGKQGK